LSILFVFFRPRISTLSLFSPYSRDPIIVVWEKAS
jgi:hypothetical protein